MSKKKTSLSISVFKDVVVYATYLLLIWGFYRLIFKLPDQIEETVVKPIIWLVPLFFLLKKEKSSVSSLGITFKNIFPAIYMAVGLGLIFLLEAVAANYFKYKGLNFAANTGDLTLFPSLGISFATAVTEEIAFRGYIFARTWKVLNNEYLANILTSLVWVAIHIPVTVFVWKLGPSAMATYLILTFLFGLGSAFIYAKTQNIASSILLHVLWEWPIILFR
jgi:membrane protease YdiL (CAAX protease family)